jgi:hypothetical protein
LDLLSLIAASYNDHLGGCSARLQLAVRDTSVVRGANLRAEPQPKRAAIGAHAERELRLNDWRVFYTVMEDDDLGDCQSDRGKTKEQIDGWG